MKRTRRPPGALLLMVALAALAGPARAVGDPPGDEGLQTVITAQEMTFDYGAGKAWFTGDVDLVDPEVKLKSDTLLVIFNADGDVERLEAAGNVRIWQLDRRGTCEEAVYTAQDGRIRMLGSSVDGLHRPARLMSGTDSLSGDEILIYVHQETVVCKPGKLVIFPDENPESTGLNRLRLKTQER